MVSGVLAHRATRQGEPTRAPAFTRREALLLPPLLALFFAWPFLCRTDPDYGWHARAGQLIWETRSLPSMGIFSFTAQDRHWVMHEWLSETLLYAIESGLGYWANALLFGLVGATTGLLVYKTARQWGLGELPAAVLVVWCYALMAGSFNVRPQVFTTLFTAIEVYIITRYKRGDHRSIWVLPPLCALWVNLHGGYVIGLALLGLAVLGEWLGASRGDPICFPRSLATVVGLSALATLVNPYGIGALLYPLGYTTGNASMDLVQEWQSPSFHEAGSAALALLFACLMVVGVAKKPLGLTETLWILILAIMSLISMRHIQLLGVVALPLFGARAQEEFPGLRRGLVSWRRPGVLAVLWPAVLVGLLARGGGEGGQPTILQLGRSPAGEGGYPSGAVAYMRQHGLAGNVLNHYAWGGYLIYELYPESLVFIDGRADPYGDEHMQTYVRIMQARPGWRDELEMFAVDLVLVEKDAALVAALGTDPEWRTAYADDVASLLVRRDHAPLDGEDGGPDG